MSLLLRGGSALVLLLAASTLTACIWLTEARPVGEILSEPSDARPSWLHKINEVVHSQRAESESAMMDSEPLVKLVLPPEAGGEANPNNEFLPLMYFEDYGVNPFVDADEDPLSTFGLDGDTASYEIARRYLRDGVLPPPDSVRLEEFVNSFAGGYAAATDGLRLYLDAAPSPYGPEGYVLLRLGVAAPLLPSTHEPVSLIFVVDVSGSMEHDNRLGLAKEIMLGLLDQTLVVDRIGLVTYGSEARTEVSLQEREDVPQLPQVIANLSTGGATNAEEGLQLAYAWAAKEMDRGRDVRLVLFSDGVGNVGATGPDQILEVVDAAAQRSATLTTVGVGFEGNYNDVMMERLANRGNGTYHYLQDRAAAAAFLAGPAQAVFHETARDARIQVEFNPAVVRKYRLLGYENRAAPDEAFRDDTRDFGELGFRRDVTALYELRPLEEIDANAWLATARLRYKDSASGKVVETEQTLDWADVSAPNDYFRRAAAVAEFAELLGRSFWAQCGTLDAVEAGLPVGGPAYDDQTRELHEVISTAAGLFTPFCAT